MSRTAQDLSPVTGEVYYDYPALSVEEASGIVAAASRAAVLWGETSFIERRRVLLDAADLLESELEAHVITFAAEVGGTRPWAEMNVREAAATLREAAGLASSALGIVLPSHDPRTVNYSLRGPAGVTLSIVPWNAPLILAARASAISLAVGNAVVIRPSEEAPVTGGYLLVDALTRAGLPIGVSSVVSTAPGEGRHVINAMIADPLIRRVVFIGSTAVGRSIARAAGEAFTPVVLELGGKNATIVRADADLDKWAPQLAFASFANTGQVCMCTDRILVHADLVDDLVARLSAIADAMVVGDPARPEVDLGPLINDAAALHFSELIEDAVSHGAQVTAGGTRVGRLARPTVLTGVTSACRFDLEEGFAPIVSITPFRDDDEAVALANSGTLGLIGSVISADGGAALALAKRVRAGAVHVNGPSVGDEPHVAFGGLGDSGAGRLGGEESVRFFTEQRTFYVHQA